MQFPTNMDPRSMEMLQTIMHNAPRFKRQRQMPQMGMPQKQFPGFGTRLGSISPKMPELGPRREIF